jgi:hypothetical protein
MFTYEINQFMFNFPETKYNLSNIISISISLKGSSNEFVQKKIKKMKPVIMKRHNISQPRRNNY